MRWWARSGRSRRLTQAERRRFSSREAAGWPNSSHLDCTPPPSFPTPPDPPPPCDKLIAFSIRLEPTDGECQGSRGCHVFL
jgi:hypothetical protein